MFKLKYILSSLAVLVVLAGTSFYTFKDQLSQYGPTAKLTTCMSGEPSISVEMYSLPNCRYCRYAKTLLDQKGAQVKILDLQQNPNLRHNFLERTGGKTSVPQIFIDGHHVGGYSHLKSLNRKGKLECYLKCGVNKNC
ncbi:MAG: glutaredoxin domain-containing protein [Pseudomonadota bacterium]